MTAVTDSNVDRNNTPHQKYKCWTESVYQCPRVPVPEQTGVLVNLIVRVNVRVNVQCVLFRVGGWGGLLATTVFFIVKQYQHCYNQQQHCCSR